MLTHLKLYACFNVGLKKDVHVVHPHPQDILLAYVMAVRMSSVLLLTLFFLAIKRPHFLINLDQTCMKCLWLQDLG